MQLTNRIHFQLNFEDDIIDSACVTHAGETRNEQVKEALLISAPSP